MIYRNIGVIEQSMEIKIHPNQNTCISCERTLIGKREQFKKQLFRVVSIFVVSYFKRRKEVSCNVDDYFPS